MLHADGEILRARRLRTYISSLSFFIYLLALRMQSTGTYYVVHVMYSRRTCFCVVTPSGSFPSPLASYLLVIFCFCRCSVCSVCSASAAPLLGRSCSAALLAPPNAAAVAVADDEPVSTCAGSGGLLWPLHCLSAQQSQFIVTNGSNADIAHR